MSWMSGVIFQQLKKKEGEKDEENSKRKASFGRNPVFNRYLELNFVLVVDLV